MMGSNMVFVLAMRRGRRGLLHSTLGLLALALAVSMSPARAAPGAQAVPAASGASAPAREIVVVGDSLSAELGLQRGTGWVALLAQRLQQAHAPYTVHNASISGDTTSGGLARLPTLLKSHPAVVVFELGANDALRGLPLPDTRHNLDQMVAAATSAGARALVVGIQVPPNYGRQYTTDFAKIFADVAAAHHAALVPFMLAGVADRPDAADWFQADGIHPVAKAHPIILDNIWPALKPLLAP
jgi:acyl-CoA thioesterase-1